LSRSEHAAWPSEALWFIALICSIFAIITSIQTKSMLDDLPSREQLSGPLSEFEVQRMQRAILQYKKTPGLRHWIMVFIWQFPSMTMAYAWCTYIAGLTVYICSPFLRKLPWQDRHKASHLKIYMRGFTNSIEDRHRLSVVRTCRTCYLYFRNDLRLHRRKGVRALSGWVPCKYFEEPSRQHFRKRLRRLGRSRSCIGR
jgi:hypothetical protein